ncbi:MAG TPA: ankyrin repeat domain-containing protein [Patescibacteria group bacterium]|nr:ankyrin repeat domain-containing protein [Patescibacteria group bacterium]
MSATTNYANATINPVVVEETLKQRFANEDATAQDMAREGMQLVRASKKGELEKVRGLLAAGVPVDAADENGWTALSWAVKNRHADIARALIDAGADAEHESKNGWTPMALAVKSGSPAIIAIAMGGLDRSVVAFPRR